MERETGFEPRLFEIGYRLLARGYREVRDLKER
jgi:hypothetical protein